MLGKFLPPHRGHQFLIDFARQYAPHTTVLVCTLDRDPIPGHLRFQWIREMFPHDDVDVVHISEDLPQTPEEHPDFWHIWRRVIHGAARGRVDFFFASEEYGSRTAEAIGHGCHYVEVDRARQLVSVSGTVIRSNPMKYWDYLPPPVRPYFLKRVCIFGPESTGKSTLARDLARSFETLYVHEYARPLLDPKQGRCEPADIELIVRGQVATEEALSRQANRVLFCDTDVLTTILWSELLFGHAPAWVRRVAEERRYDLYLMSDVDVPWVDDGQRFWSAQQDRETIRDRFLGALQQWGRPYVLLRGGWEERFQIARQAVSDLLDT